MNIMEHDVTYGLLTNALDASYLRQKTISNNIANVNTPDYKANRVVFEQELKKAISDSSVDLQATRNHHMGMQDANQRVEPRVVKDTLTTMRNDGNNVDIDGEMANLAANQLLYNTLIQQTNSKISTLRYVIQGGR